MDLPRRQGTTSLDVREQPQVAAGRSSHRLCFAESRSHDRTLAVASIDSGSQPSCSLRGGMQSEARTRVSPGDVLMFSATDSCVRKELPPPRPFRDPLGHRLLDCRTLVHCDPVVKAVCRSSADGRAFPAVGLNPTTSRFSGSVLSTWDSASQSTARSSGGPWLIKPRSRSER